jgi:hypothetical protein
MVKIHHRFYRYVPAKLEILDQHAKGHKMTRDTNKVKQTLEQPSVGRGTWIRWR